MEPQAALFRLWWNGAAVRMKYEGADWVTRGISPKVQFALREAQKESSDSRHQIDYLIEKYKVKVTDAVPPEPLPKGAIS